MLTLLSTGSNQHGQLAHSYPLDSHTFQSTTTPTFPPPHTTHILHLAFGANHTVLLLRSSTNQVWAAGHNAFHQLDPSSDQHYLQGFQPLAFPPPPPPFDLADYEPTAVTAAWTTTFVAFTSTGNRNRDSLLLCLGSNDHAELGIGPPASSSSAGRTYAWHVFREEEIIHLQAGVRHVVLLLRSSQGTDRLLGWGGSRFNQLGYPSPLIPIPTPLLLGLNEQISSIEPSFSHTVLLSPQTTRFLGRPSNPARPPPEAVSQVSCTWGATFVLDPDARLVAYGKSIHGLFTQSPCPQGEEVVFPPEAPRVSSVHAGSEHVLTRHEGEVWGWGWNEHGNLGDGSTVDWKAPKRVWPGAGGQKGVVRGCWAGNGTSWILLEHDEEAD